MIDDGQNGVTYAPPFCYFEGESLKFNNWGTNTGPCTTSDQCICRQNDFCAKTPCGEGQGDCDDDTECEGSLVCGHMNCMNSTVSDCCTQQCNNDSDCLNQECNTENKQCRLDSYSTDWSNCSLDSPCSNGEGDCDNDAECDGSLLCGINNCEGGLSNMDCCKRSCNNDSDCINQECNTDANQCRLDSYSTNWSKCSQDSPCGTGEGDCDLHSDCEGRLMCGSDNCGSGPKGMDCCQGNSELSVPMQSEGTAVLKITI